MKQDQRLKAVGQSKTLLSGLARAIERGLSTTGFPNSARGQTHLSVADFSGTHSGAEFVAYSFLNFDIEQNRTWMDRQQALRSELLRHRRRLSFKGLNDGAKRRALPLFLAAADDVEGALIVVAVAKTMGSLFQPEMSEVHRNPFVFEWKPRVREHLRRILLFGALAAKYCSKPGQDLYWITDQDEIAANERQLRQLTTNFGHVYSNLAGHGLRHVRVGTTQSDDGSLFLEDSAAIADMAAGATCELVTALVRRGIFPATGIISRMPRTITWKTQVIASWLVNSRHLRKILIVVDTGGSSVESRVSLLQAHQVPSLLI